MHNVIDRYGRELKGLRISLTAKCNLSCFYCHGEGQEEVDSELSLSEIEKIAENFGRLGVENVKLTGGEPLLREDIGSIASAFTNRGMETGITTNGTLLTERLENIASAGVKRINVNLPSIEPEIYEAITGRNLCQEVLIGCRKAAEKGMTVKLNVVVLKGLNDGEHAMKMLDFARKNKLNIQFIELEVPHNETTSSFYSNYHVSLSEIEHRVSTMAKMKINKKALHNTSIYILEDGTKVEIVAPMGNPEFCNHCTRLRITASGKIKPCLFLPESVSIRKVLEDFEGFKETVEKVWHQRKPYFR